MNLTDLRPSFLSLSDDERLVLIRETRRSRRTPKESGKKVAKKKAKKGASE